MRKIKCFNLLLIGLLTCISCRSNFDFERQYRKDTKKMTENLQILAQEAKEEEIFLERQITRPIIINVEEPSVKKVELRSDTQYLIGADALKENRKNSLVKAEYEDGHLLAWVYREDSLYEVQTQTFHSTFIELEPGEQMLEEPYISEPEVWRISRGVSYKDGIVTQHLVIKPDFSALDSTLIIVTDRRVYHLEIRSYKDRYMPIVKWIYPQTMQDSPSWKAFIQAKQAEKDILSVSPNVEYLSFDYKMNFSKHYTPYWLPKRVYDDGKKTYIVLDEKVLTTQMPAVFNERNKIMNYRVQKNIIIIDQLIKRVTLKIGYEKVVIQKKKVSKAKAEKILAKDKKQKEQILQQATTEANAAQKKKQPVIQPIDPIKRGEERKKEPKKPDAVLPGTEEAIKAALESGNEAELLRQLEAEQKKLEQNGQ